MNLKREYTTEPKFTKIYTINVKQEPELVFHREFGYPDVGEDFVQFDGENLYRHTKGTGKIEVAKAEEIVSGIDTNDTTYLQKELIIIEPRLEKILAAKYNKQIAHWRRQAAENESKYQEALKILSYKQGCYNNLPWWKKIFTFTI